MAEGVDRGPVNHETLIRGNGLLLKPLEMLRRESLRGEGGRPETEDLVKSNLIFNLPGVREKIEELGAVKAVEEVIQTTDTTAAQRVFNELSDQIGDDWQRPALLADRFGFQGNAASDFVMAYVGLRFTDGLFGKKGQEGQMTKKNKAILAALIAGGVVSLGIAGAALWQIKRIRREMAWQRSSEDVDFDGLNLWEDDDSGERGGNVGERGVGSDNLRDRLWDEDPDLKYDPVLDQYYESEPESESEEIGGGEDGWLDNLSNEVISRLENVGGWLGSLFKGKKNNEDEDGFGQDDYYKGSVKGKVRSKVKKGVGKSHKLDDLSMSVRDGLQGAGEGVVGGIRAVKDGWSENRGRILKIGGLTAVGVGCCVCAGSILNLARKGALEGMDITPTDEAEGGEGGIRDEWAEALETKPLSESEKGQNYMANYLNGHVIDMTKIDSPDVKQLCEEYGANWAFVPDDAGIFAERVVGARSLPAEATNEAVISRLAMTREAKKKDLERILGISFDADNSQYTGYDYDQLANDPTLIDDFLKKVKEMNPEGPVSDGVISFYENLEAGWKLDTKAALALGMIMGLGALSERIGRDIKEIEAKGVRISEGERAARKKTARRLMRRLKYGGSILGGAIDYGPVFRPDNEDLQSLILEFGPGWFKFLGGRKHPDRAGIMRFYNCQTEEELAQLGREPWTVAGKLEEKYYQQLGLREGDLLKANPDVYDLIQLHKVKKSGGMLPDQLHYWQARMYDRLTGDLKTGVDRRGFLKVALIVGGVSVLAKKPTNDGNFS